MRQQSLSGFALHQRAYRERSHIVHFFSQEFGRVDGVLRQTPPPLYHFACLQAGGKSALKNFSQLDLQGQPFYLQQKALFAGFYLNEILIKLLPLEEAMPQTFHAYGTALEQLKLLTVDDTRDNYLKWTLRRFEHILLNELGYTINFSHDATDHILSTDQNYDFVMNEGFRLQVAGRYNGAALLILHNVLVESNTLFNLQQVPDFENHQYSLTILGQLYREIINQLLGQKPLKSRQLWQSQTANLSP